MHDACLPSAVPKKQGKTEMVDDRVVVACWQAGSSPRGAAAICNPAPGESRGERGCCSLTVSPGMTTETLGVSTRPEGPGMFWLGKP